MIPILCGSQKGNGMHLANLLEKEYKDTFFTLPIDELDLMKINEFDFIIFIISTHGDGQCPFNMSKFWNIITSDLPKIFEFKYVVLCLGDSKYPKYNWCGKMTYNRLEQLGAIPLGKVLCNTQDKNGNYDGYNKFKTLLNSLNVVGLNKTIKINVNSEYKKIEGLNNEYKKIEDLNSKYKKIEDLNSEYKKIEDLNNENKKIEDLNNENKKIEDLNSEYKKIEDLNNEYKKIEDLNNENKKIEDLNNENKKIEDLNSEYKKIEAYENYRIKTKKYRAKIITNKVVTGEGYEKCVLEIIFEIPDYKEFEPGCCIGIMPRGKFEELKKYNLKDLEIEWLEKNINLYTPPHQTIFKTLSDMVSVKRLKNKLLEIFSDYELYHSYVIIPKRNIFEILDDFEIKEIKFDFFKNLDKITMRYYSCSLINGRYHILATLIEHKTYLKNIRKGLCSEYLKNLRGEIEVEMMLGNLLLTNNKLLFFATGSGITLPRSVKHYYKDKKIKVFYGFRRYAYDLLCKNEFDNNEIYYAASVDDKKYVMDVFRENPVENIDEWSVFVSGNTRINKEINKLMKEIYNKEIFFNQKPGNFFK